MTRVIQFIGQHRALNAAGLFYSLGVSDNIEVEFIQDPAKKKAYAGELIVGPGRLNLITDLYESIDNVVRAGVPWVVVDTHLLEPLFRSEDEDVHDFCRYVYLKLITSCTSLTVITGPITRDMSIPHLILRQLTQGNTNSRRVHLPNSIEAPDQLHKAVLELATLYDTPI